MPNEPTRVDRWRRPLPPLVGEDELSPAKEARKRAAESRTERIGNATAVGSPFESPAGPEEESPPEA